MSSEENASDSANIGSDTKPLPPPPPPPPPPPSDAEKAGEKIREKAEDNKKYGDATAEEILDDQ